jgi:hypothetical protein
MDSTQWVGITLGYAQRLTKAGLEIHGRYFPEMWQVALVLRSSASEPARAGFFFRELGGSIHASAAPTANSGHPWNTL